jgi:4-hydroxy-3-polyprenylbenzoate decarboxylase
VLSQFPPSESSIIKRALLEASLLKHLRENLKIPGIADVHALEAGGCTATLWVSIKKLYTGHVDQIAFAIWGYFGTSYYKWIIVTDDDVDIRDPFMRDWVFSWIVRPDQDVRIIPHSGSVELDPSTDPPDVMPAEKFGAKAIIDATRKWKYPAISLPPQECIDRVLSRWGDYGLPPLDQVRLPKGI